MGLSYTRLHQGLHAICTSGQDGTRLSRTKWAREPYSHAAGYIRGYELDFASSHPTSTRPSPHQRLTWHRSPRGWQAQVVPAPKAPIAIAQGW
jgi:hypothetical protein